MTRWLIALAVAGALAAAPAAARADDLPSGQLGTVGGVRQGTGQLGEVFGLGGMLGMRAGWQRSSTERHWSFGVGWEVLWGFFAANDPGISNESLRLLEMNLGLRVRRLLGQGTPRFLLLQSGVTVLRSNVPIPPDSERNYVGPYVGLGIEQYLLGRFLLTVEWRYGVLVGGPGSLTGLISFSVGNR